MDKGVGNVDGLDKNSKKLRRDSDRSSFEPIVAADRQRSMENLASPPKSPSSKRSLPMAKSSGSVQTMGIMKPTQQLSYSGPPTSPPSAKPSSDASPIGESKQNQAAFAFLSNISLNKVTEGSPKHKRDIISGSSPSKTESSPAKILSESAKSTAEPEQPLRKSSFKGTSRTPSAPEPRPPVPVNHSNIKLAQSVGPEQAMRASTGVIRPSASYDKKDGISPRKMNLSLEIPKPTERSDVAAVDFLKSISLLGDQKAGLTGSKKKNLRESNFSSLDGSEMQQLVQSASSIGVPSKGKALTKHKDYGRRAPQRPEGTLKAFCRSADKSRMIFSTSKTRGYPITVFSMITNFESFKLVNEPVISSEVIASNVNTNNPKGVSYGYLLNSALPQTAESEDEVTSEKEDSEIIPATKSDATSLYDPSFLDDPELKTGKHRTVLNLPFFRESIIPFVNKKDLKEELNQQFRERHPWLQPRITLHKIRKLKRRLLKVAMEADTELSSLALSYVLLDKILLKNAITKEQLKLAGAACFFLAVKFNDAMPKAPDLRRCQDSVEKYLGVDPKQLLQAEFDVFAKLNFALFVDPAEVLPHLERICDKLELQMSTLDSKFSVVKERKPSSSSLVK